jgi:hypothetical protein
MLTAIVGLIGILVGILLTEFFRRHSRLEIYSKEVFQKRLSIYEDLYKKVEGGYLIATDVIENPVYSQEDREKIMLDTGMDIAKFVDQNGLYLNENLVIHCMLTFIGIEDIYSIKDSDDKETRVNEFTDAYKKAKIMIRKETGIEALDKLFGSISKAKLESHYISYFHKAKKAKRK